MRMALECEQKNHRKAGWYRLERIVAVGGPVNDVGGNSNKLKNPTNQGFDNTQTPSVTADTSAKANDKGPDLFPNVHGANSSHDKAVMEVDTTNEY